MLWSQIPKFAVNGQRNAPWRQISSLKSVKHLTKLDLKSKMAALRINSCDAVQQTVC